MHLYTHETAVLCHYSLLAVAHKNPLIHLSRALQFRRNIARLIFYSDKVLTIGSAQRVVLSVTVFPRRTECEETIVQRLNTRTFLRKNCKQTLCTPRKLLRTTAVL